jgi:hypothetical protein
MIGPGLIAALLTAALQPAAADRPSENVAATATLWGECNGRKAQEFAARPDPVETVLRAVEEACAQARQAVVDAIVRDHGAATARGALPIMRDGARARIRQTILEARGAPRQRGPGNEALALGECVGQRATVLAAGEASPDAIADAALADCAAQERAVRAWVTRTFGEANEPYFETLRPQVRASALRRVAEARAGR